MKTNKTNFLRLSGSLFILSAAIFSSCVQEEDMVNPANDENRVVSAIGAEVGEAMPNRSSDDVLEEMKTLSDELFRVSTGKKPVQNSYAAIEEFSVPPPYYASNSGSVYKNWNGYSSTYNNLSFGNRAPEHTTQWISMDLGDMFRITDVGANAPSNVGTGSVRYYLSGVGQSITLNYRVNPPSGGNPRSVTVTASSSANFLRNNVVPSPILLGYGGGPIKLTVHANEFGWLWLRIEHNGLIKYDQHYRFNYSSALDSRNGGSVAISGYDRVGYFIPYSVFSAHHSYSGYCGWFKE